VTEIPPDIYNVAQQLADGMSKEYAIVLIGSAARGRRTGPSDIDILIVGTEPVPKAPPVAGFHIKSATESSFLGRLAAGEDFEAWCTRYGVPLIDRGLWERIRRSSSAAVWPRWQTKVVHGARRLFMAADLLELGDRHAAKEELVFVLGHVARGLLLRAAVFPLSRPELAAQVLEIGYPKLAELHELLRVSDAVPLSALAQAQRYSKKLLIHLDRTLYGQIALAHRHVAQAKKLKSAGPC
jgi:predicted nucleotidyltransferase